MISMNKAMLISMVMGALCTVHMQVFSCSYPTQKILKNADHVLSLVATTVFVAHVLKNDDSGSPFMFFSMYALCVTLGVNAVVNTMSLRYKKSISTYAKILLPTVMGLGAGFMIEDRRKGYGKSNALVLNALVGGGIINMVKNFWDVYSLTCTDQPE